MPNDFGQTSRACPHGTRCLNHQGTFRDERPRETVQQITENPYLQYVIGLPGFQEEPPFHHSLMTHFRKRLNQKAINPINEWIAKAGPK